MRPFIPYGFDSFASAFTPFWDCWNSVLPTPPGSAAASGKQPAPMVGLVNLHYAPAAAADTGGKSDVEREVAAYARQVRRLAEAFAVLAVQVDRSALTEQERRALEDAENLAEKAAEPRQTASSIPTLFDAAGYWAEWNRNFLPPLMTDPDAYRIAVRSMFLPGR